MIGTGGVVSLGPTLAALRAGKPVATANKETLVAGGHLVMREARRLAAERADRDPATRSPARSPGCGPSTPSTRRSGSAWSASPRRDRPAAAHRVRRPFLDTPADAFASITPEQALRHPTWRMGAKITIDSATLANKGLEVVEAHWLYDVEYDAIDVVVHPQSVVHSAVQFVDGSLKAQLGTPDMRLPIQYALTHPDRLPSPAAAPDLIGAARLDFRAPDEARFPALRIAREAGRTGPRATAALIAADEVAVARFLDGSLDFPGIPRLLEAAIRGSAAARTRRRTCPSWSRSTARFARPSPPAGGARMSQFVDVVVTIVLFIVHPGRDRPVPRARPLHHRPARSGAGPRVRRRLPAARQGAAREGRDALTLNWLPIGGFVKLEGEDGDHADDPRSFGRARLPTKLGSSSPACS